MMYISRNYKRKNKIEVWRIKMSIHENVIVKSDRKV